MGIFTAGKMLKCAILNAHHMGLLHRNLDFPVSSPGKQYSGKPNTGSDTRPVYCYGTIQV